MTLTHIIPSLRASVPDPIGRDLWPEFTTTTLADVTVAGVSLTRLADWCGTPCVHTAAAVVPGTGGMPSPDELASVIVARVLEVSTAPDGSLDVWIDARFAGTVVVDEVRMIGRVSTACDARARIHTAGRTAPTYLVEELVSDLRVGDLLVAPCRGVALLREIDPDRRHLDDEGPSSSWAPTVCGR
ncbi:hypothetical protein ASF88_19665 [Leifsonia sp. Leaf336]|uniref:hypothetical protein n=1 Tax=Leifsonia sp. Leaf336 TaxID=1736341 RepID=UPI000700B2DE|nr:hypothetical protein [Leifsonia sp. Leaf336]KQR51377.1 hypothetical protein ASF88_19665 [Leifsonia sp. Leaf336]